MNITKKKKEKTDTNLLNNTTLLKLAKFRYTKKIKTKLKFKTNLQLHNTHQQNEKHFFFNF